MKHTLLSLLLFILGESVIAQVKIHGTVRDSATSEPIASAIIFVEGSTQWTTTDGEGVYSLRLPQTSGTVQLTVSHTAYQTVKERCFQARWGIAKYSFTNRLSRE